MAVSSLTSGRCITRWSRVTAPPCPPVHLSSQPVRLASSCLASLSANKPIQALLAQSSVSIHPKATPCPSTLTPIEHYSAVSQGRHVLCVFVCVSDEQWGRHRRRKDDMLEMKGAMDGGYRTEITRGRSACECGGVCGMGPKVGHGLVCMWSTRSIKMTRRAAVCPFSLSLTCTRTCTHARPSSSSHVSSTSVEDPGWVV